MSGYTETKIDGMEIEPESHNQFVIDFLKVSGVAIDIATSGVKYTQAYDWFVASSSKLSIVQASGNEYSAAYEWMVNSGAQYTNILESGTKYTQAYTWFDSSAQRISEFVDSGNEYSAAYTHSQDNSQAHSDYILNDEDDDTSGTLTAKSFVGPISSTAMSSASLKVGATRVTTILDEDAMSSDSATALATQQSIKAYTDTLDTEYTAYSSNARIIFTNSSNVNWTKITAISSGFDGRLDTLEGAGYVDTSGTPSDNDFAKFTDADTIEGRNYSETRGDLGIQELLDSGTKYTSAYVSTSTGVFEPALTKGDLTATSPIALDQTRQVIGGAAVISINNYIGSTQAIARFADSSNINARFVASGTRLVSISSQKISSGTIIGGLHYPADYIIYKEGTTYYAKNGSNGLIDSTNTNLSTVMQYANDNLTYGNIQLLGDTYELDSDVQITSYNTLTGIGKGTLLYSNGPNPTRAHIYTSGSHIKIGNFRMSGVIGIVVSGSELKTYEDITLENIYAYKISGHYTNYSEGCAYILWPGSGGTLSDIHIDNCHVSSSDGIGFFFRCHRQSESSKLKRIWLNDCSAIGCGTHAGRFNEWEVGFDISEKPDIEDIWITNCYAENNWESGFHIEANMVTKNVVFDSCVSKNNGINKPNPSFAWGFAIYSGCKAINCLVENPGMDGIRMSRGGTVINCTLIGGSGSRYPIYNYFSGAPMEIIGNKIYNWHKGIYTAESSGAKIIGNTLEDVCNSGSYGYTGIYVGSLSRGTIVQGNSIRCHKHSSNRGIDVGEGTIVSDNIIYYASGDAIRINGDYSVAINNIVYSTNSLGINVGSAGNFGNRVIGNSIRNTASDGIKNGGNGVTISDNIISHIGGHGIDIRGSYCKVDNNIISGTRYDGISVYKLDKNNTITNNTIIGARDGIYSRSGCIVTNNIVENCTSDGIEILESGSMIAHNKCINNSGYGIKETSPADNNFITDNFVGHNTNTILINGANTICNNNLGYVTENSGWITGIPGGSLQAAHGCASKPTAVNVTPSGAKALSVGFTVDATNISISANTATSTTFSWEATV